MIHFVCTCGNTLFFENTQCLQCGSTVGYDLADNSMKPHTAELVQCRNGSEFGVCNWVVPAKGPEYCASCSLNHMVPDLKVPGNQDAWHKMESAKRRAIYTLARLRLTPFSKVGNPDGLSFDFLTPIPNLCVMTGHDDGMITLNLNEADDLYRERQRHQLGEPYRTLVGHFRHELGHYYWDRFFKGRGEDDALLEEYRKLFGDEREDYGAALAKYYANGPVTTWSTTHITSYATSHPWEDWAETWAQYLHIVDGTETAKAFGWMSKSVPIPFTPFRSEEVLADSPNSDASFLSTLNDWAKLSPAMNELAASLGHATMFPFVFSLQTAQKILFVHRMVTTAARSWGNPPEATKTTVGNPAVQKQTVQPPPLPTQPPPLPVQGGKMQAKGVAA
ncbi:putative zinc-binding metallopeptidase [Prosthecobacter sp.]|uniref:putative zinc-binding metallopeptidase n=1 Tax=Prosthecobacter sp. TaxID=1965333 RepID=UPI0037837514